MCSRDEAEISVKQILINDHKIWKLWSFTFSFKRLVYTLLGLCLSRVTPSNAFSAQNKTTNDVLRRTFQAFGVNCMCLLSRLQMHGRSPLHQEAAWAWNNFQHLMTFYLLFLGYLWIEHAFPYKKSVVEPGRSQRLVKCYNVPVNDWLERMTV